MNYLSPSVNLIVRCMVILNSKIDYFYTTIVSHHNSQGSEVLSLCTDLTNQQIKERKR